MWENRTTMRQRLPFAAIFVMCAVLLGIAIYLQEEVGLEPCPMCIIQRYVFTLIGLVALVAAIHGPRGIPLKAYGGVLVLLGLGGAGVALRQSYIQHFPPQTSSCGADLEFLVNSFPISEALPKIFQGTGDCALVKWRLVGLSIAEWAFVWFVIFVVVTAWLAFVRKPRQG